jgi:hypothetical protein
MRRQRFRFSVRALLAFTAVIAAMIDVGPWLYDYLRTGTNLPPELDSLVAIVAPDLRQSIGSPKVYWVEHFIARSFIWRFNCSQEAFGALCKSNKLRMVAHEDVNVEFFHPHITWWNPDPKPEATFAETCSFPYGFLLMYDKGNHVVIGIYDDPF